MSEIDYFSIEIGILMIEFSYKKNEVTLFHLQDGTINFNCIMPKSDCGIDIAL